MKIANKILIAFAILSFVFSAQAQQYSKITLIYSDPDGTPIAATDVEGNVEWKVEHYPFGREYENSSQDRSSDISYAGKPYDEEIGLSYFGGRWYDPDAGRFTGVDPMPVQENDYKTFNRYAYSFNNPYKYTDPDGNLPFLVPLAIFVAKEITAEAASRATYGATDFLSFRKVALKGGKLAFNSFSKIDNVPTAGAKTNAPGLSGGATKGGDETFEILDGVRRSKAADLLENKTINADILIDNKVVGTKEIPIDSLLSPRKNIPVSRQRDSDRFFDTFNQTKAGSKPPNIQVTPGSKGTPIKDVGFD